MKDSCMTDEEIEVVAQELAKVGGASWYPGRSPDPLLRAVHQRYLDRARIAIAALDRHRAAQEASSAAPAVRSEHTTPIERETTDDQLQVGSLVVYRPPGDQRAIPCRIEKVEEGRAYLVACLKPDIGWVLLDSLQPAQIAT
jgi:hypothetical protein